MTTVQFPSSPGAAAAEILQAAIAGDDQLVARLVGALTDRQVRNALAVVVALVADHGDSDRLRTALEHQLEHSTPDGAA